MKLRSLATRIGSTASTGSTAAAAATVLCTAASILAAPAAIAAPNSLVAFGDSVMANPIPGDWLNSKIGVESVLSSQSSLPIGDNPNINHGCATDPSGMAKQTAARLGLSGWDYSCSGASAVSGGRTMSAQVDSAIAEGGLDGGTRVVLVQMGFNDVTGRATTGATPQAIHDLYLATMIPQIDRIRAVAPNAQIKILGYPSISDNTGVCLLQLGSNIHTFERLGFVTTNENTVDWMQRDLAAATGTQFVDIRGASMGHGMCAPDGQRWYGALVDLGQSRHLPFHMTDLGKSAVADFVARS